jgi:hypothetical protein
MSGIGKADGAFRYALAYSPLEPFGARRSVRPVDSIRSALADSLKLRARIAPPPPNLGK